MRPSPVPPLGGFFFFVQFQWSTFLPIDLTHSISQKFPSSHLNLTFMVIKLDLVLFPPFLRLKLRERSDFSFFFSTVIVFSRLLFICNLQFLSGSVSPRGAMTPLSSSLPISRFLKVFGLPLAARVLPLTRFFSLFPNPLPDCQVRLPLIGDTRLAFPGWLHTSCLFQIDFSPFPRVSPPAFFLSPFFRLGFSRPHPMSFSPIFPFFAIPRHDHFELFFPLFWPSIHLTFLP